LEVNSAEKVSSLPLIIPFRNRGQSESSELEGRVRESHGDGSVSLLRKIFLEVAEELKFAEENDYQG
jgi:hypothetical protein